MIYKYKLIQVWYDSILHGNTELVEDKQDKPFQTRKTHEHSAYAGASNIQKDGHTATITAYRSYTDIDIRFEDGTSVENINVAKWRNGTIRHPSTIEEEKRQREERLKLAMEHKKPTAKDRYLGMTRKMNCGLSATVIEYKNSSSLTIQFENGVIRKDVRADHFNEGKVAPRAN